MGRIGWTNWQDTGLFPLQDHDQKVADPKFRQQLAGGRIESMRNPEEAGDDPAATTVVYARENGIGTIGDVHPWAYWQTRNRQDRGTGAWSMAWAGLTSGGGSGGAKPGQTGQPIEPTEILPFRGKQPKGGVGAPGEALTYDVRFEPKTPEWPRCFPVIPQGVQMMVMPATEEGKQVDVMLHADPRLMAVNVEGPAEAGTLVVDLQPNGEPCMDGADTPGIEGRASRLQSMLRVVAMPKNGGGLPGVKEGNSIAWNLAKSSQDNLAGFGMVFAKMDGGAGAPKRGPTTGLRAKSGPSGPPGGLTGGDVGRNPCEFGEFSPAPEGSHGIAFMASEVYGPFHPGSGGDKHQIGQDRDGHPMNSGHLSINAYWYEDATKDGPFLFEGYFPPDVREGRYPRVHVHLEFDQAVSHPWLRGNKPGKWRWWTAVPYLTPNTNPPGDLVPPKLPPPITGPPVPKRPPTVGDPPFKLPPPIGGPPSRGPITPGAGEGQPPRGGSWRGGGPSSGNSYRFTGEAWSARSLSMVWHPFLEGFAELAFRPQFMESGGVEITHTSTLEVEGVVEDETSRPQVLAMRTWGAQSGNEWDYVETPWEARARGGTAHGGVLFSPPCYELEDYLGINTVENVRTLSTASYLAVAPGVGFALGTPTVAGGLGSRSVVIAQDLTDTDNDRLLVRQVDSSGVHQTLVTAQLDQATDEQVVTIEGTEALGIPRGTTAQRPTALGPFGGQFRVNTDIDSGNDVPEYYDSQNASWRQFKVSTGLEPVTADVVPWSGTAYFSYTHNRGEEPDVTALDSSGNEVEVCVTHLDVNTILVTYVGTMTGGSIILK